MNCTEAREKLLIADINGESVDAALDAHVAECAGCSAVRDAFAGATRMLSTNVRTRSRRRVRRMTFLAAIPLAAAVVFAVVPRHAHAPAAPVTRATVSVQVQRGQQATILATPDPTVTVVWLSPGVDP